VHPTADRCWWLTISSVFTPGITPLIYSWSAANTAGETKKVTMGALFMAQCAGNVVGPTLYTTEKAPLYRRGLISSLVLFIVLVGLYAINWSYLIFLNKRRARKRRNVGKKADRVDWSMKKETTRTEADLDKDTGESVDGQDHSLSDATDFENEDFLYVYCKGVYIR
jgi:predicted metal-binding membrane protein